MKIGIIGAMQEEVQLLVDDLEIISEELVGMRTYYSGKLFGKEVVIVFSRCGKVAAASTVTTLIERYNVDLVLFTGVAGATNSNLNIGDIVIGDKLIQHDMDASALQIYKKYEIPLLGITTFEVNPELLPLAQNSALHYISDKMRNEIDRGILSEFMIETPQVVTGTIASGDQFIADSSKTKSLAAEIENLQCIEMEGAAVAQVCYEHGVDYLIFRVISDKADEHANVNFSRFVEKTARYFTRGILKHFILHSNI